MATVQHPFPLRAAPVVLLVLLALLLVGSLRQTSVTVDEFAHLPAGLLYWQSGDFSTYHHNPPLVRLVAAAPVLALAPDTSGLAPGTNRWETGLVFQRANRARYHQLFMAGRLAIVALTLVTGVLLYGWARRALGPLPGLVALFLFTLSPTVLAHGGLVTTDAGFALAFFACFAAAAAVFDAPSWPRVAALGVLLGIAQLAKFTALLAVPLLAGAWLAGARLGGGPFAMLSLRQHAGRLAAVAGIALVVVNAGYGFAGTGRALGALPFVHPGLAAVGSALGGLPSPLPAEYWLGLDAQLAESGGQFRSYLLGETSTRGWLYYDAALLLFKVPFPLWLLLGGVAFSLARGALRPTPLLVLCLAVPALAVLLFSVATTIHLGIRYLLFALPFLYLAAAHLALVARRVRGVRLALLAALAWYGASSLAQYPHYLAYFSDVVGRSANGHRLLADSNLDWGQDLIHLRREMEQRGLEKVALAHFGLVDPSVYGVRFEPLGANPDASVAAVSVNLLLGIDPWRQAEYVQALRGRTPFAKAGSSIWLFELE